MRKRRFAPLSTRGRRVRRAYSRRAYSRRTAKIDTALKAGEVDVFAGYAEDLYDGLERMFEGMSNEIEDLENQIFYTERDLKDSEEKLKHNKKVDDSFETFASHVWSAENLELDAILDKLRFSLAGEREALDEEVEHYEKKLEELKRSLVKAKEDPLYDALGNGNKLAELEQDDSIEGLTAFATAIAEVIAEAGDDFIFDILGGGTREFILMMERIGL